MNKNFKSNQKVRFNSKDKKEKKDFAQAKRMDFKEYHVSREAELLEYLINDLHYGRNTAKNLLSHHVVSISGAPISQFDFKIYRDDIIIISKSPIKRKERKDIPIIYEDDEFIVINKPYGLLSIQSETEKNSTAYRMVMDYLQSKDKHNRIFITHRLDRETSGVLMFSKNEKIRDLLQKDWNDLVIKRGYFAIVEGQMEKKEDTIVNYLLKNKLNLMYSVHPGTKGAQKCITKYKVLKENKNYSLLDIELLSGRKNQIRVALGDLGHYVVGDDKYGEPSNPLNRLCLHAYELSFKHPVTGKIYKFDAPTPKEFFTIVK